MAKQESYPRRRMCRVVLELTATEMDQLSRWLASAERDYKNFDGWGPSEEALSTYIHDQLARTGQWPLGDES